MLLSQNFKLIVNNVIDGVAEYESWKTMSDQFSTCFVGVVCPLDELTRRELTRGNRIFGSAAEQFYRTHEKVEYDLVVKTDRFSSAQCVNQIINFVKTK
jgi:chloramphenicol 3-O phosphotransferase